MANSFQNEVEANEMEALASLAENLVYRLKGCSDVFIRKTIQEVYRDFCRRSCCLHTRRHSKLLRKQAQMPVPAVLGGIVDNVTAVTKNGRKMRSGRDYTVSNGFNPIITFNPVHVVPDYVDESQLPDIEFTVLETPFINSEKCPSWFIQKYGDAIISGVLARLMAMGNQPWADGNQASIENIKYENMISEARLLYHSKSDSGDNDLGFAIDTSELI